MDLYFNLFLKFQAVNYRIAQLAQENMVMFWLSDFLIF